MLHKLTVKEWARIIISKSYILSFMATMAWFALYKFDLVEESSRKEIEKTKELMVNYGLSDGTHYGSVLIRAFFSSFKDMITPDEYCHYRFYFLNRHGKSAYMGNNRMKILTSRFLLDKYKDTFDDKFETYKVYGRFYKRELVKIVSGGGVFLKTLSHAISALFLNLSICLEEAASK